MEGMGNGEKRILIVDDQPDVRWVMREWLDREGYEVEEASDGKEALEILTENPIKRVALITDCQMQGLSGINLIREIFHLGMQELLGGILLHSGIPNGDEEIAVIVSEFQPAIPMQFAQKPMSISVFKEFLAMATARASETLIRVEEEAR